MKRLQEWNDPWLHLRHRNSLKDIKLTMLPALSGLVSNWPVRGRAARITCEARRPNVRETGKVEFAERSGTT